HQAHANQRIVDLRGIRNRFIDRPEFVAAIWYPACGANQDRATEPGQRRLVVSAGSEVSPWPTFS
ncbi:MAG: hypothetical protein ACREIR_01585, partial [Geminicoccaceae bacterium]